MIYLDTHIILWLYEGNLAKLSKKVKQLINTEQLFVSPIVVLELQYLYEINRITVAAEEIIDYLSATLGLQICTLPFKKIAHAALKLSDIRDPFDRIIVANTIAANSLLMTKDKKIHTYYKSAIW